jgi:CRISPR system Cascade subunit CasA
MPRDFSLLTEPWLPVRDRDGVVRQVGLRELFRDLRQWTELAEPCPPSAVAIYRVLLAILHRSLVHAGIGWADRDRADWYRHGVPEGVVDAYLTHWSDRFWLFDDQYPFMQVACLDAADETRDKRKPWTQVALDKASGNTPVMFDHSLDDSPTAVRPQEALIQMLGYLQFTPGGLVKTFRDSDKAGPLANTAAAVPMGPTLSESLTLALHPAPLPGAPADDRPAWELAPVELGALSADPTLPTGPNDRYTRLSRAILLEREPDRLVRWLRFGAGIALEDSPHAPDPMASFRPGADHLVRVTFTEGRAFWRDLPALLPSAPGEGFQAAQVMQSAALVRRRLEGVGSQQPVWVVGLASEKAKLVRWRSERIQLPPQLLIQPSQGQALRAELALAETLYRDLKGLAVQLVAGTMPDGKNKETRARAREIVEAGPLTAAFFSGAERSLPDLMEDLAQAQPERAQQRWQLALKRAAGDAWWAQRNSLGENARVWVAEAQLQTSLGVLLRKHLLAVRSQSQSHLPQGGTR